MSTSGLPLNAEQVAVVREVFGDDIAHYSDLDVSFAVSDATFDKLASGAITPEHVAGAMAHLNEAHDIPYGEMRLLDTAEALSKAMDDAQTSDAWSQKVDVTLAGELVDYKQTVDSAPLVEAVEQHMQAVAEFNDAVSAARGVLGDAVSELSDLQLADRLGGEGLAALADGRVSLTDALAAQAILTEQVGAALEQTGLTLEHVGLLDSVVAHAHVGLPESVAALARAQDDLADDQPFHHVTVTVEVPAADGFSDNLTHLVSSDDLVAAVAERTQAPAAQAEAEADAGMTM